MNIRRKCFAVLLVLVLLLSMAGTVYADEKEDATECVRQMINYYRYYKDDAKKDINCLAYELSQIDEAQAQAWASIMEYWSYVNNDMTLYSGVLPDGLPDSNALCIVVLGYQLNSSGSMRGELIGRLETALKSAEKYPDALIVCTGGGTAKNNKNVTEAGQMAKWLMEKGIDEDRIIVENKSMSTVGNARNTCSILAKSYPQITHLALVTSDYHLPRASLLFHTQATLTNVNDGAPLVCIAANAAYDTGSSPESFDAQLSDMMSLTGIKMDGMAKPELSKLDCILVSGVAQCVAGTDPKLQVTAYYDTGLYRDVTNRATYSGIDPTTGGMQDVTVAYEEDGIEATMPVQLEIIIPETKPPTEPPTEAPTETAAPALPTEAVPEEESKNPPFNRKLIIPVIAIVLLVFAEILIIIRLIKLKKQERAVKAAAKEDAKRFRDDDSPLEYT